MQNLGVMAFAWDSNRSGESGSSYISRYDSATEPF